MRAGRPFRFLVAALGGWAGLRVLVLLPPQALPASESLHVAGGASSTRVVALRAGRMQVVRRGPDPVWRPPTPVAVAIAEAASPSQLADAGQPLGTNVTSGYEPEVSMQDRADTGALPPPLRVAPPSASRWSGSAWGIMRANGSAGGLGVSQLGGSQAGARIAYALGPARRVALVGRIATPLEGRGREAALGVELRVPGAPVRLFAEQRFALDGGARGGPGAGVIAGVDRRLAAGFRLEAYGQAGAIGRDRLEGFADGAARVTRVAGEVGRATVDLGIGAWGGAQRDAERLDVGPTLGLSVPVGERRLRLTLDYRARVAGSARPGSGPALSLGTDF